jgi:hypothetical protein
MLEAIGPGASTTSGIDWHDDVWPKSPERDENHNEMDHIHKKS